MCVEKNAQIVKYCAIGISVQISYILKAKPIIIIMLKNNLGLIYLFQRKDSTKKLAPF